MSRTYRRRSGDQSPGRRDHWRFPDPKVRTTMWHADGYRFYRGRSVPSEWTRMMMTRPQRAEVRRLTHKVMCLHPANLVDAPIFPHPKRPHQYYW